MEVDIMKQLKFYDVARKHSFVTAKYRTTNIKGRVFAIAKGVKGNDCYRILGKK